MSRDGNTLAYFAAGSGGAELRVRDMTRGTDAALVAEAGANRGFPAISLDGKRIAFGTLVAGPPVKRPVFVANIADGASRLIFDDCGGRPRLWPTTSRCWPRPSGRLNSFIVLDTCKGKQRLSLAWRERRLSSPRLLRCTVAGLRRQPPGGSPSVLWHGSTTITRDETADTLRPA